MIRFLIILALCFIVVSLFSGLYRILRYPSDSTKGVKMLTVRVALSILLFVFILISSHFYQGSP